MTTEFFATHGDLIKLFVEFERLMAVKYLPNLQSESRSIRVATSLGDVRLGMSYGVSGENSQMVFPRDESLTIEKLPAFRRLPLRYAVMPANDRVVTLIPGGEFDSVAIVLGSVVSFARRGWSRDVGRLIRDLMKRRWRKSAWLWLSPTAENLWRSGRRLCSAVKNPVDVDFIPPGMKR